MRPADLAAFEGQQVTATLSVPERTGPRRSYEISRRNVTGILRSLGAGVSVGQVTTMAAYVDSVEPVR